MGHPAEGHNVRPVGRLDIPGGGQVVVVGKYAYVAHMEPPHGTSIVDVSDPRQPKLVNSVNVPGNIHSHKVRVRDNFMLVNYERYPPADVRSKADVGLKVYDIADPTNPKVVTFYRAWGRGVHRFDLDDRYGYFSMGVEGYRNNIAVILDLADPARPREVGRWWVPGQWVEGGEEPLPEGPRHWVHFPLRRGDRLYVGCGHQGMAIVDVSDIGKPETISRLNWHPPYAGMTHTVLPVPHLIRNRRFALVTDEQTESRTVGDPAPFMWIMDITEERWPLPVATCQVDGTNYPPHEKRFGIHQPWEDVKPDNLVYTVWFSGGLRITDISNPYRPEEVGHYVPATAEGQDVIQSNDVFVDVRGLIYVIDRFNGLDILEYAPHR